MCCMVLAANVFAVLTGEWQRTSVLSRRLMALGLAILLVAIVITAVGAA